MTLTDAAPAATFPDLETTRAETHAAVDAIVPMLRESAAQTEANRHMSDEVFNALIDAGALRLFAPRRYGGLEAGYRTYVEITAKVVGACGTAGWFCFIINHGDWQLGQMSQASQDRVWSHGSHAKLIVPLAPAPGFVGASVDGGMRLSGKWPYSSGSDHATFGLFGFPVIGDDGIPTDNAIGLASMSEVSSIDDTWHVSGMAGTSSNTVNLNDVFVPDEMTITMGELLAHTFHTPHVEEAQYHLDAGVVFHTATLAPVVGLARAARDLVLDKITTASKPMTYTFYTDTTKAPATQFGMARASWLVDTAYQQLLDTADALDAQAQLAAPFSHEDRGWFAMRAAEGHRMCREAFDLLLDVSGAGSFALANPLQRMWRDMHMASRHGMSVPGLKQEVYGRSLLGADEQQMTPIV